ncbi:hypothetical protein LWI29_006538 [Acer saccharum]|uniref:Uncharacterized protein n=1 Tax=Acer saccharum TaxID=4024 RepID=A0AA39W0Y3_ACESA|nr:hypothetical protein LWI29_006538 [Acer saccharum]
MSSKRRESKSPALASSGKNEKKEKDAEDAKKNKSPDKLLTAENFTANEKPRKHQSEFGPSNIEVLGGGNDKLPAETGQTDISNNFDRLSTKNSSPAGDKQETPQKSAFGLVDHKFTPEYPHGKMSSSEKIKQAFGQKPQPKDTPQKSGDSSQPQPKATHQKSHVTSQPHQVAFQVNNVPGGNNALKKKNTEKDEKQTSSSAHGPLRRSS